MRTVRFRGKMSASYNAPAASCARYQHTPAFRNRGRKGAPTADVRVLSAIAQAPELKTLTLGGQLNTVLYLQGRTGIRFPFPRSPLPAWSLDLDTLVSLPTYVWAIIHVLGLLLAIASRGSLGPRCAVCTYSLLAVTTLTVAGVAVMGYIAERPFWAVSGCTLGAMAIATVFETRRSENALMFADVAVAE